MPVQGQYIRALCLAGVSDLLAGQGHDLAPLLAECGLPESALRQVDMLVEFRRIQALFELAAHRFGIADLGLRAALHMQPHFLQTGPVLALARFSPNVREWMRDATGYWGWHTNAFWPELVEEVSPGQSVIRVHSAVAQAWPRQHTEHMMTTMVSLTRNAAERQDNASVVRFQHHAPADTSLHAQLFGCPVEFGCEHTEVEFRSEILDYPTGRALVPLRGLVRRYIQHRIGKLDFYDAAFATNVALAITAMIGTGKVDMTAIADVLDVHPKQMQRLLAQEGTSFSAVLEDVRRTMAKDMLAHSSAPVGQVAGLLGYAANAPFTVAFRKWTGLSPRQWRQRGGKDDAADD